MLQKLRLVEVVVERSKTEAVLVWFSILAVSSSDCDERFAVVEQRRSVGGARATCSRTVDAMNLIRNEGGATAEQVGTEAREASSSTPHANLILIDAVFTAPA